MDCRFVRGGFLYMISPYLCDIRYNFLVNHTSEILYYFIKNQQIKMFLRDDYLSDGLPTNSYRSRRS